MRRHSPPSDTLLDTPPASPPALPVADPLFATPRPVAHLQDSASADTAVHGAAARSANGVTGAGLKIGILSDSMNVLGGMASDIAAGLLPASGVTILKEGPAGTSDEGRAMAQLIHQTAPGAQLLFYTAFDGEQDFGNGIDALRKAGCQVIVDDITYPDEPMFQIAGPIDAAVHGAVAAGVDYFTAAGNEGSAFYQAVFTPVSAAIAGINGSRPVMAQRFANGATSQIVDIPRGLATTLTLEWDANWLGNNPDSLTVDAMTGTQIAATSAQTGTEPDVFFDLPVRSVDASYSIVIFQNPGTPTPGIIKYVLVGGGSIRDPQAGIGSGSAIGHALVAGANAVGAVNVASTPSQNGAPTPEQFSSTGPGQILLAPDGSLLATPQSGSVPQFLAPDGARTSVLDPFFGTSAAAPVAAATAALMLQADPTLTDHDLTVLLDDSAIPAGAASVAGAGLIQADLAVGYARTGVISGSPQPAIFGTSRGGTIQASGGPQFVVPSSAATSVVAGGADTVLAGAGADTVDLTGLSGSVAGGSGPLWVGAVNGQDTITGGSGSVTVAGGSGSAVEHGSGAGHNLLIAGTQPSTLVAGGAGDTLVAAGAGGDFLSSDVSGPVTLSAGQGAGLSTGGNIYSVGGAGQALVLTGPGSNTVILSGGDNTVVIGGASTATTLSDGTQVAFANLAPLFGQ